MVEFMLHLIEEYYPSYDKARKSVFADVHFLLFYTAIINALFSIITAVTVTRISKQLWIQTELLELNHYLEIQQSFLQIEKELNALHSSKAHRPTGPTAAAATTTTSPADPEVGTTDPSATEDPWSYGHLTVMDTVRYPNLKHQYDTLLAQIRYHDLRTHVIHSYQLPKRLQISSYLMRCSEQTVLMKLVNVSSLAWLLLTGAVCIFYFVFGIVFYKFEDQTLIGTSLSIVFFGWMISFVVLCFVLSNKTKSILYTLLHSTELWDVTTKSVEEKERLAQKQLALFWYGEPRLIIKLVQLMQFGYAASLSTVIVFWTDIDRGKIPMYGYVGTLVVCYVLFIQVIGHAIPRYTLCTSLGQLVNDRYLRETVAMYRLAEAKQKEMEQNYDDHPQMHTSSSSGKPKNLHSSVIIMDQDIFINSLRSEPETISNLSLKTVQETIPEEQLVSNDRTQLANDDDAAALVTSERSVQPDDNQEHTRVTNMENSGMQASINLDNLVHGRNDRSDCSTNEQDTDDEDDNDDLYVSYADNLQPSVESSNSAAVKPDFRRTMMMKHRNEQGTRRFEKLSCMHRVGNYVHSYFTSERHIEISNVYGAIVAFFLVGQRVEGFIHSQEIVSSDFLSFHYRLDITFWLLTTWLAIFIGSSVLILLLLWYYGDFQTMKGYKLGTAALIDFIISSVCLVVLFIAEINRCCDSDDNLSSTEKLSRSSLNDPGPVPCSCPQFGTREYGGLGTIEPYVSLIFLRILRHWVARKVMKAIHRKYNWPKVKISDDEEDRGKYQLAKSTHQITKFGGQTMNHLNNLSIVTEMWEEAIGANPDIAAQYGEFSSEILRAMLGLPSPSKNVVSAMSSDSGLVAPRAPTSGTQLFALQKQYSDLSPEAQEIILSGKMGRRMVQSTSCKLEKTPLVASPNMSPKTRRIMFEVDNIDSEIDDQNYNFKSPNARLIHSMRRCDRKFLPLLDKWTTVDVLITRFEVVYLEVAPDDNSREDSASNDCIREALKATKGGKGLRLCDVVAGRRVTGRVNIADINCLHVERYLPYENDHDEIDTVTSHDGPAVEVESIEYWMVSSSRPSLLNSFNNPTRTQQWCHVKEDHLTMETASGTLVLRFFADLEDAKQHPEHLSAELEADGRLFQNNALQWVKSIAKVCGPEQLTKQDITHFGENSSDELRDYIVTIDRKKKRHSHARVLSDGLDNMLSFRRTSRPNLLDRRQTTEGVTWPNLVQRVMSVRAMSANASTNQDIQRNIFDAGDTSSNMNGGPSSGLMPTVVENEPSTSKGRKVSFSQPATSVNTP